MTAALEAELAGALPCDVGGGMCPYPASHALTFRRTCGGGEPVTGPGYWLICAEHRELLLNMPFADDRECGACGRNIADDLAHVIAGIEPIGVGA